MALVLRGALKLYYYLNEDIADPRTQNWFLMRTPWPGLALICVYLMTVFRWLPEHMKNRPAYELRKTIAFYNAVQIVACCYIVYKSMVLGWLDQYSLLCHPADAGPHGEEYAFKVCYLYFFVKIVDLLDTIFFILRKKQNQVTFLHVYHHFGMIIVSWGMVKWQPGGHLSFLATVNSFVHIIMYTYYLLTAWDESYKQSIWWKKHVTQLQLLQFTALFLHFLALLVVPNCAVPKPPAYLLIPQNLFMVILFGDFYYKSYIKKKTN